MSEGHSTGPPRQPLDQQPPTPQRRWSNGAGHPPAPATPELARVQAEPRLVDDLAACDFYHTMDVPGHGRVEGHWDLRPNLGAYLGNVRLAGKRVLEVGAADGFITFQMERQGAHVVSYDLSDQFGWDVVPYARILERDAGRDDDGDWVTSEETFKAGIRRLNNAYWLCHRAFGSTASLVHGTVYDVPGEIGEVDVCTFGSLLLHTRDPFGALASALRLTRETVIVTEPRGRIRLPAAVSAATRLLPARVHKPAMRFLPAWRTSQNPDGWWRLSPELVVAFLGVLGFEHTRVNYHAQLYKGRTRPMFTVVGQKGSRPSGR